MKVLVTGAAGLLGSHVVKRLLALGYDVRCAVRDLQRLGGPAARACEVVSGDLACPDVAARSVCGVDAVIHAAARLGGWGPREAYVRDNVVATENIVRAVTASGVHRLIYISSATSYGLRPDVVLTEETPAVCEPDFYCETKLACEAIVRGCAGRPELAVTILRPSILYGPDDSRFLGPVVRDICSGTMTAIGRRGQGPPLVYVEDVARFIAAILRTQRTPFELYNLSSPENVSWEAIAGSISGLIGVRTRVRRIPFRLAYGLGGVLEWLWKAVGAAQAPRLTRFVAALVGAQYHFDASKALAVPGFRGFTPFDEAIARSHAWICRQCPAGSERGTQ